MNYGALIELGARNAPPLPALACSERLPAPDASRSPGPCSAGKPRKGRGFACPLAELPTRLPSCHGLEHAACVRRSNHGRRTVRSGAS
jgi:hypothetical protein